MDSSPTPQSTDGTKRLFVVVGMHRAGTSLVTRSLMEFGVDLGSDLLPAVPGENETGFWEDREVVEFNDRLLAEDGLHWASFQSPSFQTIRPERLESLKSAAAELIRSKLSDHRLFGLKDPRLCRMLPFWHPILCQEAQRVEYLLAVRHPDSVAASLSTRDGFDPARGVWLWLSHMVDAIGYLERAADPRVSVEVVDYDYFVSSPAQEMGRLSRAYRLPWDPSSSTARQFLSGFVQPRLRHHAHDSSITVATAGTPLQSCTSALHLELRRMTSLAAPFPSLKLSRQVAACVEFRAKADSLLKLADRIERSLAILEPPSVEACPARTTISIPLESLHGEIDGEDLDAWLRQALGNAQSVEAKVAMRLVRLEQQLADARVARDRALREAHEANQQNTDAHRALEALRNEHSEAIASHAAEAGPAPPGASPANPPRASRDPATGGRPEHSISLAVESRLKQELASYRRALHEAGDRYLQLQSQIAAITRARDTWLAQATRHRSARQRLTSRARAEIGRLRRALKTEQNRCAEAGRQLASLEAQLRAESLRSRALALALRVERLANESLRRANAALCASLSNTSRFGNPADTEETGAARRLQGRESDNRALRLNDELERIRGSLSWRITAPVRWLGATILRGTGGRLLERAEAIRRSGLFDEAWYLRQNPDVARTGADPIRHYIRFGEREGRRPRPDFDPNAYLESNPDVLAEGKGAFVHWVMEGRFESRPGSPEIPAPDDRPATTDQSGRAAPRPKH